MSREAAREAERLRERMTTPVDRPLPGVAAPAQLYAAEREMVYLAASAASTAISGACQRRVWTRLRSTRRSRRVARTDEHNLEELYEVLCPGDPDLDIWKWPAGLLPLIDASARWICVETTGGTARRRIRLRADRIRGMGYGLYSACLIISRMVGDLGRTGRTRPATA